MTQVEIPTRSLAAKHAISTLFQEKNDIDIYIEDTAFGYEKLFTILLSRIFKDKYRINKVFPLGGRGEVIRYHNNESSKRPFLYIIDGDLFLLTGDTVESKRGLYRLPCYCIENILCDHESIIEVLDEEESCRNIQDLRNNFNYQDWELRNKDKLFKLFIEYAISKILNPQKKTVAFKVSNLVSCDQGAIDDTKLQCRIDDIRNSIISVSSQEIYDSTRAKVLSSFESSSITELSTVSGKDYLFPLLKTRAKSTVKTKISDINFKQRIAKRCDLNSILDIENYVSP